MSKVKMIFIGGAGRSGTTLMQKVLLAHPKIAGGAEFYYTKPIFELYQKMLDNHENRVYHSEVTKDSITKKFKELYNHFFTPYVDHEIKFVSEKTPTNIDVVNILLETFKDAKFIHVYRDGRAVLNSHFQVKKRAWKAGKNLTEISLIRTSIFWRNCMLKGDKVRNEFKDRMISVCYEDMVLHPSDTFDQVFRFLGLEPHEHIDRVDQIKLEGNKSDAHINGIWYTKEMYEKAYDKDRVDRWKKEMSFLRRFIGTVIMYDQLKIKGYRKGYRTNKSHEVAHKLFFFFYNIKDNLKSLKILYPLIYLKRKLQ